MATRFWEEEKGELGLVSWWWRLKGDGGEAGCRELASDAVVVSLPEAEGDGDVDGKENEAVYYLWKDAC